MNSKENPSIAVVIPCYNEGVSISKVISDFRNALPEAAIFVFDNNSRDNTIAEAKKAGAQVYSVKEQGKGNVVRRMFANVNADIYVMVDGDATYDASCSPMMIDKLIAERLDMVVGVRKHDDEQAYRPGHTFGNKMLTGCVKSIFGGNFSDMLSGYRVFSSRYAKSFPAMARGFETETELTVHALELRMPYGEFLTPYGARMEGSSSKLSTYKDGLKILKMIIKLYSSERPLAFFGIIAAILFIVSFILALPLASYYFETGLVPRLPTALLSTGLVIVSSFSFLAGLILENVTLARREIKRLAYLSCSLLPRGNGRVE
ncbi:glycosyltransferase family 2 protein [Pantoea sp. CFSAN033090]|uniref:glycosyltransferase family 2 protein n=1 Tax=Pantoea sp. CFSAN033090 TaxID=1690502 RepID=UPI000692191E|nr:glycosyltransferase family 2 protein [Pantoea sp. CFSAN033090]KOA72546.1 glycosyl transferase family protein [Pantoea sp. CFSAN033090]